MKDSEKPKEGVLWIVKPSADFEQQRKYNAGAFTDQGSDKDKEAIEKSGPGVNAFPNQDQDQDDAE